MPFYGNPNKTITAISTSGGIVCSRTSGQTPCFVQASASAITATGTSKPYEDLEYSWDFGDPSGTELFNQPLNSALTKYESTQVNANSAQTGPEAVYCYRSAGTYTITLTIRGGPSGSVSTTVTQNITVSAFSASGGEYYFAPQTGNDANNGLTSGTPKQSLSALNTLVADDTAFNINRGEGWTGTAGIAALASRVRFRPYGSGANPFVNVSSGSTPPLSTDNHFGSARTKDDIVWSNIDPIVSGTASTNAIDITTTGDAANTLTNIYLDNCNPTGSTNLMQYSVDGLSAKAGIWGGTYATDPLVGTGVTIGTVSQNWGFVVGAAISGIGSNGTLHHHIYPGIQTHALFRYLTFGGGTSRNYCINVNYDSLSGSLETAQNYCISDCDFTNASRAWDASDGDSTPDLVHFQNFVGQRNAIHGLAGNGVIFFFSALSMTVRDNLNWGNTGDLFFVPGAPLTGLFQGGYYRNKSYKTSSSDAGSGTAIVDFSSVGTFTLLQTITDNIIHDTRASANLIELGFTAQSGATVDRNQYYFPNDSDSKPFFDLATAKSFAQWQSAGFDTNGSVADPGWLDPANGDFRTSVAITPLHHLLALRLRLHG